MAVAGWFDASRSQNVAAGRCPDLAIEPRGQNSDDPYLVSELAVADPRTLDADRRVRS